MPGRSTQAKYLNYLIDGYTLAVYDIGIKKGATMNASNLTEAQRNLIVALWGYTSFTDRRVGAALVSKGLATVEARTGRKTANSRLVAQYEYSLNDAGLALQLQIVKGE